MFTPDDAFWLSDTILNLYAAQSVPEFVHGAMGAIDPHFNLVASACEEVGVGASLYVVHGLRCSVPAPKDYAAYHHDNPFTPVIGQVRTPTVLHLRRQVTTSAWAKTDHFNGIARPMGWNDQLMAVAQSRPSLVVVGLYRDRLFSEREHELIRLLQPHITAAWVRVRHPDPASSHAGALRIRLTAALRPVALNAGERVVLRAYFPHWRDEHNLPPELQDWMRQCLRDLQQPNSPPPLRAFATESVRGRLLVRCYPHPFGAPPELVLVETPAVPDFRRLLRFGLTARECEVLHWIARGKRDGEIAAITACAPSTVSKHVEHILAKLHAETRSAAVSRAGELLSGS